MPAQPFAAFIGVLQAEQQRQGISDAEHARRLGVTGAYWGMLQSDGPYARKPGAKFLLGALRAYPHAHPEEQHVPTCVACQLRAALEAARDHQPITSLLPEPASLNARSRIGATA